MPSPCAPDVYSAVACGVAPEPVSLAQDRRPGLSSTRTKLPGEFELIARITAGLPDGRLVRVGPGDDCAVLRLSRAPVLFTVDSTVEGVHFKVAWGSPELLGARALLVNLSDIAAMGGTPTVCVVNLAVRDGLDARFLNRLYAGLKRAARRFAVELAGGNVTRASELSLTIALLGEAPARTPGRHLARAGDAIYVTGTLGDAAAGWRLLDGRLRASSTWHKKLVDRYLNPAPRLAAGRALARTGLRVAAIDVSDGLIQDLGHVLERSRVGARLDLCAIPLSPAYRAVMGEDRALALGGGEDYELLFCMAPAYSECELGHRLGVAVSRIGQIVEGRRLLVRETDGRERRIDPRGAGFDQLGSKA